MSIRSSTSGLAEIRGPNSIRSEDGADVGLCGNSATLKFREDKFIIDVDLESTGLEQTSLDLTSKEESSDTIHPRGFLQACKYLRDWSPQHGADLVSEHNGEDKGCLQEHDSFGRERFFRSWWVFSSRHSNVGSLRFYISLDLEKRVLVPSSNTVHDVNCRLTRL